MEEAGGGAFERCLVAVSGTLLVLFADYYLFLEWFGCVNVDLLITIALPLLFCIDLGALGSTVKMRGLLTYL